MPAIYRLLLVCYYIILLLGFSFFLILFYNFSLLFCSFGNEMSVLPSVIVNATSKHTASVSLAIIQVCMFVFSILKTLIN